MEVFSQFTWVSDRDSKLIRGLKFVKITDANCIPISASYVMEKNHLIKHDNFNWNDLFLLKIIYYCMKTPNMRLAIAVGLFLLLVDIAIVVLAK